LCPANRAASYSVCNADLAGIASRHTGFVGK
jgi:hypothetical protein